MPRTAKFLTAFIALFGLTWLALWSSKPGYTPLSSQRLLEVRVGFPRGNLNAVATAPPGTNRCCIKSELVGCGGDCVTNPDCSRITVSLSTCKSAHCTTPNPPDPNSRCTGAVVVNNLNIMTDKCTTKGMNMKVNCDNPPGTQYCAYDTANYTITRAPLCKTGESLCTNGQPNTACQ